jgi:hypothetical protein
MCHPINYEPSAHTLQGIVVDMKSMGVRDVDFLEIPSAIDGVSVIDFVNRWFSKPARSGSLKNEKNNLYKSINPL